MYVISRFKAVNVAETQLFFQALEEICNIYLKKKNPNEGKFMQKKN